MSRKFLKTMAIALIATIMLPFTANAATTEPEIIGEAAIVMDMDTGEVIYSKNADDQRSPASTTKLLTSLIFAESVSNKSAAISYTENSASLTETTLNTNFMGNTVEAGDTMTADDVMKSVMIYSANDASIMMAEYVAGSIDDFATLMNEKAKELGATNSNFINPNGLEVSNTVHNVTTAYDLALIAKAAYQNQWVRDTMALSSTNVTLDGLTISIETRNKILGQDGNVGGKTGTETMAGHCFVGFFEENGRNLVTVVLGSEYGADGTNVFNDTLSIADYAETADKVVYYEADSEVGTVDLEYKLFRFFGPTKTITASLTINEDASLYENDFNETHKEITYSTDNTNAWKVAGEKNTELTLTSGVYSTTVTGTIDLSSFDLIKANLPIYLASLLFVVIIIVLVLLLLRIINMSKRNRNRRRRY